MTRALLSVWDKTGILDLAKALAAKNIGILSSGGTAKTLRDAGIPVTDVSEYTGFPEMMDGRVKTLHPKVHGGLLGRRGTDDDIMKAHGIEGIDILCVNLYPFEEMSQKNLPLDELIEFVDIGGPAMIRAASKNFKDVAVVVDPSDYPMVIEAVSGKGFTHEQRLGLAAKALTRTAAYDGAISNYLNSLNRDFPTTLTLQFANGRPLRYGENPHQKAAVYGTSGIAGQIALQGKEMSYNNYLDVHAAVSLCRELPSPATVIVKHNNPCGVALGTTQLASYLKARDVDPVSAYGSVVAMNSQVGKDVAEEICSTFVEVLIAPSFTDEAREIMKRKENMRLLLLPSEVPADEVRTIDGGILVQRTPAHEEGWDVVSKRAPTAEEVAALKLAWKVVKHAKSNAIIYANATETVGLGVGQMSRVDSAKLAVIKAAEFGRTMKGTVIASDAFLPFADTLEVAAAAGATALIQPGGSIRDAEVIAKADELGVAVVFTGTRHFRH
ncbi:bifunctional phosphoribosylaminoimidazolecarboxamide formyltransferase/IMP cyclohydrolase [Methanorbis rubei]|uniref:Bifunctional purine biosynthesis protein PurH n=1 Tax=Methanorbis rubei TaxID=3028300 RepID=A0AAE4MFU5_9EURY|nr:Bifunctional purine biosynthesis protein PurH [Methanocorpusculaceae archaeon Cs1]